MPPRRGHRGPPIEKAKDFKGTVKKLVRYMTKFRVGIILVGIFAAGSTVFNIAGPKVLSKATTEIYTGLVAR